MIDVHKRVHAAKAAMIGGGGDPIEPVARDLANDACVLCFDEFQVRVCMFVVNGVVLILRDVGHGYSRCDDFEAVIRMFVELWRRLCDHIKVGTILAAPLSD
jgi:hypothetical protein